MGGGKGEGERGGEGEDECKGEGRQKSEEAVSEDAEKRDMSEGVSVVISEHIAPDERGSSPSDVAATPTLHQFDSASDDEVGMVSRPLEKQGLENSDVKALETSATESVLGCREPSEPNVEVLCDKLLTASGDMGSDSKTAEEDSFRSAYSSMEQNLKTSQSRSQSPILQTDTIQPDSVPQTSTPDTSGQAVLELPVPPSLTVEDEELGKKWYITFEQFISSVQTEPDLCQFFAEQNTMDLDSSSVDPILTPYTRTVLAHR